MLVVHGAFSKLAPSGFVSSAEMGLNSLNVSMRGLQGVAMFAIVLLSAAFIAFLLSALKVLPKGNWMEVGFTLAAAAALVELAFPSR